ncbi:hypothetical protein [Schlesneria sp.]
MPLARILQCSTGQTCGFEFLFKLVQLRDADGKIYRDTARLRCIVAAR